MKVKYAKLWLRKYIKYNHHKFSERKFNRLVNWKIVNLSHRVCKRRGIIGHNIRQDIRKELWEFSAKELTKSRPSLMSRLIGYLKRRLKKKYKKPLVLILLL